jgi:hypothetical protein
MPVGFCAPDTRCEAALVQEWRTGTPRHLRARFIEPRRGFVLPSGGGIAWS